MLLGMALAFAAIATLAAVGGGWVVALNEYGRYAAIALLAVFGVTLLFPALADRLSRPLVALGLRLSGPRRRTQGVGRSRRCCWAWAPGCCGRPARGRSSG